MPATNQPTPVILSESELAEIEARSANRPKIGYLETGIGSLRGGEDAITLLTVDVDVLCQTMRAAWVERDGLRGRATELHNRIGERNERIVALLSENTTLREQLAALSNKVCSRDNTIHTLQSRLAQVEKERDGYREQLLRATETKVEI